MNDGKTVARKTIPLMETEAAKTALWELAFYQPRSLLQQYRENPAELLDSIDQTVTRAMRWRQAALERDEDPVVVDEYYYQLLRPCYCPEEPEQIPISEKMMREIIATLKKVEKAKSQKHLVQKPCNRTRTRPRSERRGWQDQSQSRRNPAH